MKFTKIKNFTENNEVRIKTSILKGKITNKLTIYIGKDIVEKHFSESNYVNVKIVKDKLGKNDIYLSKAVNDPKIKKYKFSITGNGTCQTRKLLISMPKGIDMNNYIDNKKVVYSNIDNTLILHIDSKKLKIKQANKTNKNKLIVNGIDQATLDKQFQNKFNELYDEEYNKYEALGQPITRTIRKARTKTENNIDPITLDKQFREQFNLDKQERNKLIELYEIRQDLDSNNQYRYEELKRLLCQIQEYLGVNNSVQEDKLDNIIKRLDFIDKHLVLLSPICKTIDRLDDKIDSILFKNIPNENNSKELSNSRYDKAIVYLTDNICNFREELTSIEKRLSKLENNHKTDKDKRSLFDRIFGE